MELICVILILCFFLFLALAYYTFKRLGRGWSFKALFKEFNRKIWMTLGLGAFFFSLYLITVIVGTYILGPWKQDFFLAAYSHPVEFVYGGLWLFAFLSLTIYLARIFIKYFYLTRGRDS